MEQGTRGEKRKKKKRRKEKKKEKTLRSDSFAKGWDKDKKRGIRRWLVKKAVPVDVCSKWRMDVIGQPSQRRSAACFQRALNYASLSFHQPHTGRQIKDASTEVLPSQLSQTWKDKSLARRFVTRSTTQLKSDA